MTRESMRDRMGTLQGAVGRAALAGLVLAALAAGAAAAGDRPEQFFPAHIYTETRTTLVWDGKPVVVEGTVYCERNSLYTPSGKILFPLADSSARVYDCAPEWLAARLDDGSALLVGAYGVADSWRRDGADEPVGLEAMREHLAKVPRAVIWLDDPVNPTSGEYYFSSIALDDPRSRLTAISTELVSVSRGSMVLGALFGKTPSDPAKVVPWLAGDQEPRYLAGAYAVTASKKVWSALERVSKQLKKYVKPDLLSQKQYTDEERRTFARATGFFADDFRNFLISENDSGFLDKYERSKRVCPLEQNDGVFRIIRSCTKGVIYLHARDAQLQADGHEKRTLVLSKDEITLQNQYFWYGIYFDPRYEEMYRLYSVHINPRSNSLD